MGGKVRIIDDCTFEVSGRRQACFDCTAKAAKSAGVALDRWDPRATCAPLQLENCLSDSPLQVTGFTYDGDAPAAYWWGAPSTDNGDIRGSGRRIAEMRVDTGYDGETVS